MDSHILGTLLVFILLSLVVTCFADEPQNMSFSLTFSPIDEVKADVVSLRLEDAFLYALPTFLIDDTVRKIVPKSDFLGFLNDFENVHFTAMALLTAAVIYPFDSYTAFTVLESFSVTAAITGAIKYLIGRARPYENVGPYHLTFLSANYDFQSFPSGHSALAWSIFTPVAERFGDYWYIVPAVFSAQRLWADQHWLSDVVYGGLIGWSVGSTFETNRNGE